jgi:hypothetical protein
MPNVMGREFPYTPGGMAAARQYSQAMGMRDGGPMGFRPLGYMAHAKKNFSTQVPINKVADLAEVLAQFGRHGDTNIAHISPQEMMHLKGRGGSGSLNPVTGLPEFFADDGDDGQSDDAGEGSGESGTDGGSGGSGGFDYGNDAIDDAIGRGGPDDDFAEPASLTFSPSFAEFSRPDNVLDTIANAIGFSYQPGFNPSNPNQVEAQTTFSMSPVGMLAGAAFGPVGTAAVAAAKALGIQDPTQTSFNFNTGQFDIGKNAANPNAGNSSGFGSGFGSGVGPSLDAALNEDGDGAGFISRGEIDTAGIAADLKPVDFNQPTSEEAQGINPFFAADPARYTPYVAPYMMSGGGGTPMGMRDGGPMGFRPLGMRDGGPMGFRPLGMQAGGVPVADVAPDAKAIFQGLVDATQRGSTQDVAAYIESNRRDLNDMVSMMMLPQGQADFITNTINSFAPPSVPQMNTPPRGMSDFPGYEPETGDFYPPQQQMPAPSYPFSGGAEEGEQYLIPGTPPPGSVAPVPYDPNEIGVANGGYITRNMNRGGLMSLRRG